MASTGERLRREQGTGSVVPTKEGSYRARITLPDLRGNKKPHTKRFKTEAEAEAWLDELITANRGGATASKGYGKVATVQDLMREFIKAKYDQHRITGKPALSSIRDYESQIILWILPELGTKQLRLLHSDNIDNWLKNLHGFTSEKTGKKLSHDRKHRVYGILKQAFSWGQSKGIVKTNPILGANKITQKYTPVLERVMTDSDYEKFTTLLEKKGCDHANGYCQLRWELAVKETRRTGEVLGMYWVNVHLTGKKPYMSIKTHMKAERWEHGCHKAPGAEIKTINGERVFPCGKKAQYCPDKTGGGLTIIDGTKGGTEVRPDIPISPHLRSVFIKHKKAQDKELMQAVKNRTLDPNLPEAHTGLVFTHHATHRPLYPRSDSRRFDELQKEAGLQRRYAVHDNRHTAISRIVDATGDIKVAQEIAGQKTLAITARYAKPSMARKAEAFDLLEAFNKKRSEAMKAERLSEESA